jgi:peptide-methionine (S)-S-oxide reductase
MDDQRRVKMVSSIACFFQSEPDHEATVKGVAGHLERFWEPRMRARLAAHASAGGAGLTPLALEAARRLVNTGWGRIAPKPSVRDMEQQPRRRSMFTFGTDKTTLPKPEQALRGRSTPLTVPDRHFVNGRPLQPPFPPGLEQVVLALGCFWGAERKFWNVPGVYTTAVGYAGGYTPNPTYEEVCSGKTGHTESVLVVYDPDAVSFDALLQVFWESHDPTQGMRQGNDVGTQYRSAIFASDAAQLVAAEASRDAYARVLAHNGYGAITTEIRSAPQFYYAEGYHQQYLAKNPGGYCGLGGTGVACPTGISNTAAG